MEYAYCLDPFKEPVKYVNKKEPVTILLENAFGGTPNDENELIKLIESSKHHPLTGPIYIEGIEPGMNVEIQILDIQPNNEGYQCCSMSSGILKINPFERNFKKIKVTEGLIYYGDIKMFASPSIGVVGTATDSMTRSGRLDCCGGNIDLKELKKGAKIILPCEHKGALIYFGDMHLIQANGEISGIAAEAGGKITVSIDTSEYNYKFPIIITDEAWIIVGYGVDIESSIQQATENAIMFLSKQYALKYTDSYMILSLIGDLLLGHSTGKTVSSGINISKYQFQKKRKRSDKRV